MQQRVDAAMSLGFLLASCFSAVGLASKPEGNSTPTCTSGLDDCRATRCCATDGYKCFAKSDYWASCLPSCVPGINLEDPEGLRTPWSCELLEPVEFKGSQIPASFTAPAGSPVDMHGAIRVEGNKLLGKHGQPVRLRGMSLFWSQWSSTYWSEGVVDWLVKDWKVTMIRAAMGVESGGYLESGKIEKQRVVTVVDAAIRNGIYVVIDWHDHHAQSHKDEARAFFDEMASMYGGFPNVFFEIFNEPLQESWSEH
eukprot:CAMPEP_0203956960 /NCGR_PEP_ID=MMETSP0359-20131031/89025_1 /ASSEMBLY_ACC=CAM_ASM_000338 /TAXON_ID=268821 /ORGANISM="Scrippsiella Hangoei, Strain SHTV-5" /LENGTH=253 /DNA_ID=CAMNT_0050890767 /DNA_START=16 /DNA_END=774 /DNA_ORIENTATION=-